MQFLFLIHSIKSRTSKNGKKIIFEIFVKKQPRRKTICHTRVFQQSKRSFYFMFLNVSSKYSSGLYNYLNTLNELTTTKNRDRSEGSINEYRMLFFIWKSGQFSKIWKNIYRVRNLCWSFSAAVSTAKSCFLSL